MKFWRAHEADNVNGNLGDKPNQWVTGEMIKWFVNIAQKINNSTKIYTGKDLMTFFFYKWTPISVHWWVNLHLLEFPCKVWRKYITLVSSWNATLWLSSTSITCPAFIQSVNHFTFTTWALPRSSTTTRPSFRRTGSIVSNSVTMCVTSSL